MDKQITQNKDYRQDNKELQHLLIKAQETNRSLTKQISQINEKMILMEESKTKLIKEKPEDVCENSLIVQESDFFDAVWYSYHYGIGSIQAARHYLIHGWKKQYDPSPDFSTMKYLYLNPDVSEADINPLLHYEKFGKYEGRSIFPSDLAGLCIYGEKAHCSKAAFAPESQWNTRMTIEELINRLSSYDVVSFNLFDTLILRNLRVPADLFRVIGVETHRPDFQKMRINAEEECYRIYGAGTTIFDIYRLMSACSDVDIEQEVTREFSYEKLFCQANPYMLKVFDHLHKSGKRIIITSDMYWPAGYIEELLSECGYDGWENVFVSCDHGYTKGSTMLQRKAWEDIGCSERVVHVGNSEEEDVKASLAVGWDAILYESCSTHAVPFYEDIQSSLPFSIAEAIWKNTLHNGAGAYSKEYEHGFLYGGILTLGYCEYLQNYCIENNIDTLVFLGRDMDMVSKIYSEFYGKIRSVHIDVSRNAVLELNMNDAPQAFFIHRMKPMLNIKGLTVGEALTQAGLGFINEHLAEEGLTEKDPLCRKTYIQLNRLYLTNKTDAAEIFAPAVQAAESYFQEKLRNGRKICLAELGWDGTVSLMLKSFFEKRQFGFDTVDTLMLGASCGITTADFLASGKLHSYIFLDQEGRDLKTNDQDPKEYISLKCLEAMYAANEGILLHYAADKTGKVKLVKSDPLTVSWKVEEIQKGIHDFVKQYTYQVSGLKEHLAVSAHDAFYNYRHIFDDFPYLYTIFAGFKENGTVTAAAVGKKESITTLGKIMLEQDLLNQTFSKLAQMYDVPEFRVEELEGKIEELEYSLIIAGEELAEEKKNADVRIKALDSAEKELELAKETIDKLTEERKGAAAVIDEYNKRVTEAAVTIDRQTAEISNAAKIIKHQEEELERAGKTIDRQKEELVTAGEAINRQNSELRTAGETIDRQSAELLAAKEVIDRQADELVKAKAVIDEKEAALQANNKNNGRGRKEY